MAERPFIYRFSTDLRLDDHAGLAAAASRGGVLPTIVIDDALALRLKASPRRAAFFCSAVAALDAELRELGSRLVVRRGPPGKIIAEIARTTRAGGAAWSASYHAQGIDDDRRLQSELEEAGLVTSKLELSGDGKALNYFEVADFAFELTPAAIVKAAKTLTATSTKSEP